MTSNSRCKAPFFNDTDPGGPALISWNGREKFGKGSVWWHQRTHSQHVILGPTTLHVWYYTSQLPSLHTHSIKLANNHLQGRLTLLHIHEVIRTISSDTNKLLSVTSSLQVFRPQSRKRQVRPSPQCQNPKRCLQPCVHGRHPSIPVHNLEQRVVQVARPNPWNPGHQNSSRAKRFPSPSCFQASWTLQVPNAKLQNPPDKVNLFRKQLRGPEFLIHRQRQTRNLPQTLSQPVVNSRYPVHTFGAGPELVLPTKVCRFL